MSTTNNNLLYSINAVYDNPNAITDAAKKVAEEGYTKWDVNTPYPVHGMDRAMKLKSSKLGFFALAFGLSGTAIALLAQYLTMGVDYPMIIGGKPFFPFPAFVPVMFELTVLLAAIGTVVTMIVLYFRMPNNSHPIHDTRYIKLCSSDHFGIYIKTDDPKFDEERIKNLFREFDPVEIMEVSYDEDEVYTKPKLYTTKFVGLLAAIFFVVAGVSYLTLNKALYKPPFSWMMDQPRLDVQSSSPVLSGGIGMLQPVKGTVSKSSIPYKYSTDPDKAGAELQNPLEYSEQNLQIGQKKFNTYCSPCHDNLGEGNARLRGQFPNPPSLHSEKVRGWSDGRIYHVITMGQGVMPSYSKQVTTSERWAIIMYVRALQRALNAKEEDVK